MFSWYKEKSLEKSVQSIGFIGSGIEWESCILQFIVLDWNNWSSNIGLMIIDLMKYMIWDKPIGWNSIR